MSESFANSCVAVILMALTVAAYVFALYLFGM